MLVFTIKSIRKKMNITLYELSKRTNLSRTYLRDLENNRKTNPSISVLKRIANSLNINIKELFYSELDINSLKKLMYEKIDTFGLDSPEVAEISHILDILINIKMNKEDFN